MRHVFAILLAATMIGPSAYAAEAAATSLPSHDTSPTARTPVLVLPEVDFSFFDRFSPSSPGLTRVLLLVRQKQYAAARDALSDYYRHRAVRPGFWPDDPRSIQNADDLVKHIFSFYGSAPFDAGRPIRWNDVFLNDREITYALNRHQHLQTLAAAWRRTKNPAYARAFVEQIRDWIAQNQSADDPKGWAAWRNLEVATRVAVWSDVFFTFIQAPEFSPDDQLLFLQSLHQQAAWLAPQARPGTGDWSVAIETGLAVVAVMFPEFNESAEWRKQAYRSLAEDLQQQVYPDGSQITLSPYHQNSTLTTFWLPFKLAIENRVPLSPVYAQTLERMAAYQAYLRRPDGRYPPFNSCEPMDAQPLLVAAGKFFKRPDFAFILSHGQSGTTPTSTSCAFRPSGVFIMRDNWSDQANYVAIDAGPYGTSYQQEDKLSLELAAFGRTVIVDPGRYLLDLDNPLARYLASTAAHNTLTVDGGEQRRAMFSESWAPSDNSPNCWVSQTGFDYFAGGYVEGYDQAPNVQHFRRIFFLKDNQQPYWIISDRVLEAATGVSAPSTSETAGESPSGKTVSHRLTSRWQFLPGPLERAGELGFATKTEKGNVALCPLLTPGTSWTASVRSGSENPVGGWVSFSYGKIEPAPQVIYDLTTPLPATLDYAFVPFPTTAKPTAARLLGSATRSTTKAKDRSDASFVELDFGDFRDTVFIAHDLKSTERNIGGCKTKGCFVVVRTPKAGSPIVLVDAEAAGATPPTAKAAARLSGLE